MGLANSRIIRCFCCKSHQTGYELPFRTPPAATVAVLPSSASGPYATSSSLPQANDTSCMVLPLCTTHSHSSKLQAGEGGGDLAQLGLTHWGVGACAAAIGKAKCIPVSVSTTCTCSSCSCSDNLSHAMLTQLHCPEATLDIVFRARRPLLPLHQPLPSCPTSTLFSPSTSTLLLFMCSLPCSTPYMRSATMNCTASLSGSRTSTCRA